MKLDRIWGGLIVAAVVLSAVAWSTIAQAAKLKIGDAAPNWSGIVGVDDKEHSLAEYSKAKLVVLVFTCNHCPVAVAYEDRLVELAKKYDPKDVQFVAVNVNNNPADRLDKMKERAEEKGFKFPYLYDSSQKIGVDYGAAVTPHVFVLDKDRKLAYVGAVDDNMKSDNVKHQYLAAAIDSLLKGEKPPKAVTQQFGCGIKYEKP